MSLARILVGALLCASPAGLMAQTTTLVSRAPGGGPGDGPSALPAISGDGRFVVFQSEASNFIAGDTNGCADVFRCDLWTGALELVSIGLLGTCGDAPSLQPQLSGDGRFVAFQSQASDLVAGDTNGVTDIFVRDMLLGSTIRVSVSSNGAQSDGGSRYPYLSRDGLQVAFESHASDLVPGDGNGTKDVFVHDTQSGITRIASLAYDGSGANDDVLCLSFSPDGRYVGMSSTATNLVPGDTNGCMDAFVRDMLAGTTLRVSTDAAGSEAHGVSGDVNVSAGGHYVAFYSEAADLVPGDTNGQGDVFVKDAWTGAIQRASVSSAGTQASGTSYYPRITADGRYVVFYSYAADLVPGDTNWYQDDFVRDLVLGTTEFVSITHSGVQARGLSRFSAVSDDGRYAAFECTASNVDPPDDNAAFDIFVRDRSGAIHSFCAGDPSQPVACPCANPGGPGRGCANGSEPAGAWLVAQGVPAADDVRLEASGMSGMLALFLQGDVELTAAVSFGRGLRCIGGNLLRLYSAAVSGSAASAPAAGEPSIRARSLQLGDALGAGATRAYQVWYRDPPAGGCGSTPTNVTNALRVSW